LPQPQGILAAAPEVYLNLIAGSLEASSHYVDEKLEQNRSDSSSAAKIRELNDLTRKFGHLVA
jgi:hypothetical protein